MYLLACSVIFGLSAIHKPIRTECLIVAAASLITGLMAETMDNNGDAIYWLRAAVTTSAALALCSSRSIFGFIMAAIYAATIITYALLAYDVAQYFAWVNNGSIGAEPISYVWGQTFKDLTHGFVILQLLVLLSRIWPCVVSCWSGCHHYLTTLLRNFRGATQ